MKILSWNCQGLGDPWTVRNLRSIVRDQGPMVCFLMETRLDKEGLKEWCGGLPFQNSFMVKYSNTGGGLALLWKDCINLDVVNYTANHILAKVVEEDGLVWFLTGFYGWPEATQKAKSWSLLRHIRTFVDGLWVCIGDYNAALNSTKKLSKRPVQGSQMNAFRVALEHCHLEDLGFRGYEYTWNNKRPGEANTRVRSKKWYKGQKGFKFEEVWLLAEGCDEVIKNAWNKDGVGATGLELARQKIVSCAMDLQAWGAPHTHLDVEIKRLQKGIEVLNSEALDEENRVEYLETRKELDALLLKQEVYWAQRSRINWMKHGDKNTKFFHSKASQRRRKNWIMGIKNLKEVWVEEEEDIAKVALEYFENLFQAGACDRMDECFDAVTPKAAPNMQQILSQEFSVEEVKTALF